MEKAIKKSENYNVFWGIVLSYASLGISLLGSFFITPYILNNIGDKNYGLLSFCNSITIWLTVASEALGASYVFFATKEDTISGTEKRANTLFTKLLVVLGIIAAVISIGIVIVLKNSGVRFSKYTEEENELIFLLLIISGINVSITILFSVYRLYNNFKKQYVFVRGTAILISAIGYLGNYIVAITTKSIVFIAILSLGLSLFQGIANCVYAIKVKEMRYENAKLDNYRNDFYSVVRYSSIILLGAIISNLDSNLDKTLLGSMVSAEAVTMYHLSVVFYSSLCILSWSFVETFRPQIHELSRKKNREEANRLFLRICKVQSIVVLFIVGGFISCGYHLVMAWIGPERISVYYYTVVLFVARIIPLTIQSSSEYRRANNKHALTTKIAVLSILINILI